MTEKNEPKELKSKDRRRFMELSAKFGFTAAAVALANGVGAVRRDVIRHWIAIRTAGCCGRTGRGELDRLGARACLLL